MKSNIFLFFVLPTHHCSQRRTATRRMCIAHMLSPSFKAQCRVLMSCLKWMQVHSGSWQWVKMSNRPHFSLLKLCAPVTSLLEHHQVLIATVFLFFYISSTSGVTVSCAVRCCIRMSTCKHVTSWRLPMTKRAKKPLQRREDGCRFARHLICILDITWSNKGCIGTETFDHHHIKTVDIHSVVFQTPMNGFFWWGVCTTWIYHGKFKFPMGISHAWEIWLDKPGIWLNDITNNSCLIAEHDSCSGTFVILPKKCIGNSGKPGI